MGPEFRCGQHDAVDFLEQFLDKAKQSEVARDRYGLWGGLQQTDPVATQVDRLFGHVQETRGLAGPVEGRCDPGMPVSRFFVCRLWLRMVVR